MPDPPPPSLLITPDLRRRLQQRYEEAVRLRAQCTCDFARVHELLAECLRTDPGNALYLDGLLGNLRQWNPNAQRSWLSNWLRGTKSAKRTANDSGPPDEWLRAAPELLSEGYDDATVLGQLAAAAGECQFDDAELVYWRQAVGAAPDRAEALRGLAQSLTRSGRFDEAIEQWHKLAVAAPDDESALAIDDLESLPADANSNEAVDPVLANGTDGTHAIQAAEDLKRHGKFAAADELLRRALFAAGGDLRLYEALENLQLARSAHRVAIARRRAVHDAHRRARLLVDRLEQEHNRLEIDIFHVRSERHPGDLSLRLELARRLKWAGNYSGAIQRLDEAQADDRLAAEVFLEMGECWQHLRQFGKAMEWYRKAVAAEPDALDGPRSRPLIGALYRIGVLAAAMNDPAEAKAALVRLVALEPDYKDARQRLDSLP